MRCYEHVNFLKKKSFSYNFTIRLIICYFTYKSTNTNFSESTFESLAITFPTFIHMCTHISYKKYCKIFFFN